MFNSTVNILYLIFKVAYVSSVVKMFINQSPLVHLVYFQLFAVLKTVTWTSLWINLCVYPWLCLEDKFLAVELIVRRIWTFLSLLIHTAKLSSGTLYVSIKVSISQHHWRLSFKRVFYSMLFFFFLFWMTQGFFSLRGQFILERINKMKLEMISAVG